LWVCLERFQILQLKKNSTERQYQTNKQADHLMHHAADPHPPAGPSLRKPGWKRQKQRLSLLPTPSAVTRARHLQRRDTATRPAKADLAFWAIFSADISDFLRISYPRSVF